MAERSEWLAMGEAARALGVTRTTVRSWLHRGWLRGYRCGGTTRIRPESVQELIAGSRRQQKQRAKVPA